LLSSAQQSSGGSTGATPRPSTFERTVTVAFGMPSQGRNRNFRKFQFPCSEEWFFQCLFRLVLPCAFSLRPTKCSAVQLVDPRK
jgi:hypothetical protein